MGIAEGYSEGCSVGVEVGEEVGLEVGVEVGEDVGLEVGDEVGLDVGDDVGLDDGNHVGLSVAIEQILKPSTSNKMNPSKHALQERLQLTSSQNSFASTIPSPHFATRVTSIVTVALASWLYSFCAAYSTLITDIPAGNL